MSLNQIKTERITSDLAHFINHARGLIYKHEKYILIADVQRLVDLLKITKATNSLDVITAALHRC